MRLVANPVSLSGLCMLRLKNAADAVEGVEVQVLHFIHGGLLDLNNVIRQTEI